MNHGSMLSPVTLLCVREKRPFFLFALCLGIFLCTQIVWKRSGNRCSYSSCFRPKPMNHPRTAEITTPTLFSFQAANQFPFFFAGTPPPTLLPFHTIQRAADNPSPALDPPLHCCTEGHSPSPLPKLSAYKRFWCFHICGYFFAGVSGSFAGKFLLLRDMNHCQQPVMVYSGVFLQ